MTRTHLNNKQFSAVVASGLAVFVNGRAARTAPRADIDRANSEAFLRLQSLQSDLNDVFKFADLKKRELGKHLDMMIVDLDKEIKELMASDPLLHHAEIVAAKELSVAAKTTQDKIAAHTNRRRLM